MQLIGTIIGLILWKVAGMPFLAAVVVSFLIMGFIGAMISGGKKMNSFQNWLAMASLVSI